MKKYRGSTTILSALSLLSVMVLWQKSLLLFTVLLVISVLILASKRSGREIKIYLLISFLGAFAEILSIYAGAWTYTNPDFLQIPLWLPPLWGIAAIYIVRKYSRLKE